MPFKSKAQRRWAYANWLKKKIEEWGKKTKKKLPEACHVYETSGSYTAILTVKENGVTRYTESFEITVTAG